MTAADVRALRFSQVKGFGRGYDTAEVDRIISQCAALVERMSTDLVTAHDVAAELTARLERESADAVIEHSVNVLTTAQETADKILAQADRQRDRAESEGRAILARARDTAAGLHRDSQRRAKQVTDDATRRVAALEQDIARLTATADLAQQEVSRESAHLEATTQASRAQLDEAIDGIIDHLADQYGRAHPQAAQAALSRSKSPVTGAGRPVAAARSRRGLRLAGRPADRWAEEPSGAASQSASTMPEQSRLNGKLPS